LLASGVVRIVGVVDPAILGIRAMAALGVSTDGASTAPLSKLAEMPEVTFLVATAGRYDAIAEIRCRSDDHLLHTLDRIRELEGVQGIESGKYLHVAKEAHGRPSPPRAAELDEADYRILRGLEQDGRANYSQLAPLAGLSQAATPYARTKADRGWGYPHCRVD
jgi:DNA-binding Lrp family transcriptional regulator